MLAATAAILLHPQPLALPLVMDLKYLSRPLIGQLSGCQA